MTKRSPSTVKITPPEDFLDVASRPDEDQETTSKLEDKINKLMQFFDESGINYEKFQKSAPHPFLADKKKAYPNYDQYMYIPGQHNTQKWLQAVQSVYKMEQTGQNRVQSIRQATVGWNPMETYDFLHWLRYYEEGTHLKYKMAQLWYENGAPGYFLHVKPDPVKPTEPTVSGNEIDFARDHASDDNEKRQTIEKQRNKIIGRLDSAEKLLRSPDGQSFAGKELEALMEAIYQLKKKIQLVNKMSTSTRLYEDMIVREANVLQREGFVKAATWLYSQAQANNPPPSDQEIGKSGPINVLPPPVSPESPSAPLHPGAPGGLPAMGPGMSQNAPAATGVPNAGPNDNAPNLQGAGPAPTGTVGNGVSTPIPQEEPKPAGIANFLDRMNDGKMTEQDKATVDDDLEVNDVIDVADSEDELMVSEAQMGTSLNDPITTNPAPARRTPAPPPKEPKLSDVPVSEGPATETPLEVTEDDIAQPPRSENVPAPDATAFDEKIDSVFANLRVDDVVAKLEDLAKIFKVREVPRQLAIVDMMLDSLGLASYFPSLSEAQNKALDSNNYISTRVEDILSKLRGAMSTKDIDLKGGNSEKPEVANIKNKLTNDAEKEKQRKLQRKEQSAAELSGKDQVGKETPEVEIEEDLTPKAPPAAIAPPAATAPTVPTRPVPPPLG
jgi:ferritin